MSTAATSINVETLRQIAASPAEFRRHVLIDTNRGIIPLGECVDDWQAADFQALDSAWLRATGRPAPDGKRFAWLERPRGHSKTRDVAIMVSWALALSPMALSGIAAAGDAQQAGILKDSIRALCSMNPILNAALEVQSSRVLNSRTGSRLEILSSDAPTNMGHTPNFIVLDELTCWKSRDLWEVLFSASEKIDTCLLLVITNAGVKGTWQWELRERFRDDPAWHFHSLPGSIASWYTPAKLERLRAGLTLGSYKRLIENQWTDISETALLKWEEIAACHSSTCLWPKGRIPKGYRPGPLYIGYDVGRVRDLSVISTIELCRDGIARVREILVLERASYDHQEAAFTARMNRGHVVAARIDRGTIGHQLAERMEKRFGGRVEGISMGATWQGQAALKLATRFRQRKIEIPPDPVLTADLGQVEEVRTGKGGVPVVSTDRTNIGHADRFWSLAAAVDAFPVLTDKRRSVGCAPRGIAATVDGPRRLQFPTGYRSYVSAHSGGSMFDRFNQWNEN